MEALALAAVSAVLGYAFGRYQSTKAAAHRQSEMKVGAYKELFAAFVDADRALVRAHMIEGSAGAIPEEVKEQVGTSLNALLKSFESSRFLFPAEVANAMNALFAERLGQRWGEQCDALRRARDSIYSLASRDVQRVL